MRDAAAFHPMLATLVKQPVAGPEWVFERKFDGIRCGVIRRAGTVRLLSRRGEPMNDTYPELVDALAEGPDLVADGEIVAFDHGVTSFGRLQQRSGIHDAAVARRSRVAVYLYLFDLLELAGEDLRAQPLRERKRRLRGVIPKSHRVRFTPHRHGDGALLLADACRRHWEGLIAKRIEGRYVARRSHDWLKLKCSREQELVIGGWTEPRGSRERLGAILVGYYDGDRLRYAGKVGTGFDARTLERLGDELERRERPSAPFAAGTLPRDAHWAEPQLVAQIAFAEWTRDGRLRQPRYLGLRDDKPAREVVREEPLA